jgi:bifunctional non-homologous end joining protein LigD
VENLGKRLTTLRKDPWADIGKTDQVMPERKRSKRLSKD